MCMRMSRCDAHLHSVCVLVSSVRIAIVSLVGRMYVTDFLDVHVLYLACTSYAYCDRMC